MVVIDILVVLTRNMVLIDNTSSINNMVVIDNTSSINKVHGPY